MHRLLEQQIKETLGLDASGWLRLTSKLQALANGANQEDELSRLLAALPGLLDQVGATYLDYDQNGSRRQGLDVSPRELIEVSQRRAREALATSQALAALQSALEAMRKCAEGSGNQADDLLAMSAKLVELSQEQERIREALTRSEERFELAMSGANDGVWDYEPGTGKLYFSPRWKEMIGLATDEIRDSVDEWVRRVHPEDLKRVVREFETYERNAAEMVEFEFRFRHKEGHYLWILSRGKVIRDAEGHPLRMVGTHTDITRRVELERHLAQFKQALDEHAIVSVTDVHGAIIYANDKFCQISGYSRKELYGRNHRILKSGVHTAAYYEQLWKTIATGKTWTGEICNLTKNGQPYWVLATITPILGMDGLPQQYIAIRTDISRIKEAENTLIQAKDAAESASRAKSEFLANMSHEIRTPMNGVLGMLNLALETVLDEEQQEYLSLAQSSANALLHILNDILDLSKIEAGRLDIHLDQIDLGLLLRELGRFFEPRCREKGLAFSSHLDPALPAYVLADPVRLRQVLTNLLSNALKFTHSGEIRLEIRRVREASGEGVRYAVHDTGIGIPPERQAQVFEAFTQADGSITRRYGGTGLGLTISSRLTQLMGGQLDLRSEEGRGSEFFLVLPLRQAEVQDDMNGSGVESASDTSAPAQTLRVLVAEDNPVNQKLASLILEREGHRVHIVENGQAVLEALAREPFDLVLMDLQMPDMGGLEATRLIREKEAPGTRPLPIIALTANAFEEDREKCLAAGMNGFVTKPMRRADLFDAIAAAVAPAP